MIRSYKDLEVYQISYRLAMKIFNITADFPKEEAYSLVSQMRKSSRSIPANIAEGWSKRRYENLFKKHLTDAIGSCDETKVWLDFSLDCNYIDGKTHVELIEEYNKLGKMLFKLLENWKTYA